MLRLGLVVKGHPKTQTTQTADCRLQTVQTVQTAQTAQTVQTVQTVQTDYFFLTLDSLFLVLLLPNSVQYVPMSLNTKRKILKMLLKPKNLKSNVNFSMS